MKRIKTIFCLASVLMLTSCDVEIVFGKYSSSPASEASIESAVASLDKGSEESVVSVESVSSESSVSSVTSEQEISSEAPVSSDTFVSSETPISSETSEQEISSDTPVSSESTVSSETSSSSSMEVDWSVDPYENMTEAEFYQNYQRASCYEDAVYRSEHHFLSGDTEVPDYLPTVSSYQPMDGSKYIFNNTNGLSADGKSYTIFNAYGDVVKTIYLGGAYITLEDVAAYCLAFGDVPANYIQSTSTSKLNGNEWGKYLRLNNNYFSCDTSKYKYEPELPELDDYKYYEIDIGCTGCPDLGTSYSLDGYNDGTKINRGTNRIVYTKTTVANNPISSPTLRHVFYTYNHYNDFQEYLNYEGGWGLRFGNMTGGGEYNASNATYKTSYPAVTKRAL